MPSKDPSRIFYMSVISWFVTVRLIVRLPMGTILCPIENVLVNFTREVLQIVRLTLRSSLARIEEGSRIY